jgi:hypothetical protein
MGVSFPVSVGVAASNPRLFPLLANRVRVLVVLLFLGGIPSVEKQGVLYSFYLEPVRRGMPLGAYLSYSSRFLGALVDPLLHVLPRILSFHHFLELRHVLLQKQRAKPVWAILSAEQYHVVVGTYVRFRLPRGCAICLSSSPLDRHGDTTNSHETRPSWNIGISITRLACFGSTYFVLAHLVHARILSAQSTCLTPFAPHI